MAERKSEVNVRTAVRATSKQWQARVASHRRVGFGSERASQRLERPAIPSCADALETDRSWPQLVQSERAPRYRTGSRRCVTPDRSRRRKRSRKPRKPILVTVVLPRHRHKQVGGRQFDYVSSAAILKTRVMI